VRYLQKEAPLDTYIWNQAARKGREKPPTMKVVRPIATPTLFFGPDGNGTTRSRKREERSQL